MSRPVAALCMDAALVGKVYAADQHRRLGERADLVGPAVDAAGLSALARLSEVEVLATGWGAPRLDEELLSRMPSLRLVLYAAGSVRPVVTPALWRRGVRVVSAAAANAVPVVEHTSAQVVLALNHVHRQAAAVRRERSYRPPVDVPGVYGATVGVVSLGMIGRGVARRLQDLDVRVLAHDPVVDGPVAQALGVELVDLDELFRRSEVVSLHAPLLPATTGMVGEALLRSLPHEATLVNTARGALVDEAALVRVLRQRHDLWALLDVTWPEPPAPDSPLYELDNIVLTPHIAGSTGRECRRLADLVLEELDRYRAGTLLQHEVDERAAAVLA